MSFRFLHTGDIHLDSPFAGKPQYRIQLRDMLRYTLSSIVDVAIKRDVHAVVIAGDLFIENNLSFPTQHLVESTFKRLIDANISIIYATGNHDPKSSLDISKMPKSIIIFDDETPKEVIIHDGNGEAVGLVVGSGYSSSKRLDNPALSYPTLKSALPIVGVLHTQLNDIAGNDHPYAPTYLKELKNLNYDYWALGHIHIPTHDHPYIKYCGCACGTDFSEQGVKGAFYVDLEKNKANTEFIPLAPMQWLDITPDLIGIETTSQLIETIAQTVFSTITENTKPILRINLTGPCPLYEQLTASAEETINYIVKMIKSQTDAMFVEVNLRGIGPVIDSQEYRNQPHMLSAALSTLDKAKDDDLLINNILSQISDLKLLGTVNMNSEESLKYVRELLADTENEMLKRCVIKTGWGK